MKTVEVLFVICVVTLTIMLVAVVWSVAFPNRRCWPPPGKRSVQYWATWISFWSVSAINLALLLLDWNSWHYQSNLRLIVGIPITVIGFALAGWGIAALGVANTSGLKQGFVTTGPYRFTRNPQYLGDILAYLGLSVIANSVYLWICHLLLVLVFVITPLTEEFWLEQQYGTPYLEYKKTVPRFL